MNSIEIKIAASIAHPGVYWRITFDSSSPAGWRAALDDCATHEYATLGDLMHSEVIPRSTKGALRDLMQAGNLWPLAGDPSQRWA